MWRAGAKCDSGAAGSRRGGTEGCPRTYPAADSHWCTQSKWKSQTRLKQTVKGPRPRLRSRASENSGVRAGFKRVYPLLRRLHTQDKTQGSLLSRSPRSSVIQVIRSKKKITTHMRAHKHAKVFANLKIKRMLIFTKESILGSLVFRTELIKHNCIGLV